ncbi:MAG: amidohydrolase family protein [Rhizobiales bacterium]|nr:amidohydrolase family protein [Hyphomicrobiales bacterium]NRB15893.1 amidohydrolase family protein [Hyphomicrobiales bacterium]
MDILAKTGGVFEALGQVQHLNVLAKLVARHPRLQIILDHGVKPEIAARNIDDWAAGMEHLAKFDNVTCKLSGQLTVAEEDWSLDQIAPYVAHMVKIFGANHLKLAQTGQFFV